MKKLVLIASFIFSVSICLAQPGLPDLGFNPDDPGFGYGNRFNAAISSMIEMPDGRYLVRGLFSEYNGIPTSKLAILSADGDLDSSFQIDFDIASAIQDAELTSSNKIFVAGELFPVGDEFHPLARLNLDGSVDNTFQLQGNFSNFPEITEIAVKGNGGVIVAGQFVSFNGEDTGNILAFNSDGTLDNSFDFGAGFTREGVPEAPLHIMEDPDGGLLVSGAFDAYNGVPVEGFCRLDADGSLDTFFSGNFSLDPGFISGETVYTSILLPGGKIAIGGSFAGIDGEPSGGVAILNIDGTRDENFVPYGGGFSLDLEGMSVRALAYHPADVLLIGGSFDMVGDLEQTNFAALNLDGSLSAVFNPVVGTNDIVNSLDIGSNDEVIAGGAFVWMEFQNHKQYFKMDSNGDIIQEFGKAVTFSSDPFSLENVPGEDAFYVCGAATHYAGVLRSFIVKIDAEGNLLNDFDPGLGISGPNSNVAGAFMMEVQADGKPLVAGQIERYNGSVPIHRMVRLNTDGSLDESFDIEAGPNVEVGAFADMAMATDGGIYVSGAFSQWNGLASGGIVKLNTDGSVDESFAVGSGASFIRKMAVQEDGKVLIAGDFTSYQGNTASELARLNTDGSLDTEFNPGSFVDFSTMIRDLEIHNGNIYAAGQITFQSEPGVTYGLVVFQPDGSLLGSFEGTSNYGHVKIDDEGFVLLVESGGGAQSLIRLTPELNFDPEWPEGADFVQGVYDFEISEANGDYYAVGPFESYFGVGRHKITRIEKGVPVGLDDNAIRIDFKVFPNPSEGSFVLSLPDNSDPHGIVRLYTPDGRLVLSKAINSNRVEFNIGHLSSGLYLLSFNGSTKPILKQ